VAHFNNFWCDWRSAQVVDNLVLFLRQFANSIFSLNSQQILVVKVSNDRQCSITLFYEQECIIFPWKFRNFKARSCFRSSLKQTIFGVLRNNFPMGVKIYTHFLMLSKNFEILWFSTIIISTLWIDGGSTSGEIWTRGLFSLISNERMQLNLFYLELSAFFFSNVRVRPKKWTWSP